MIVTFISQCEKNALKKTRRVLDSFANRIGDNTWQTIITMEGLNAVQKLLRRTASKSTAVSCHRIRTRSRSELFWVVGNRERFNEDGIVPVHRTQKTILDKYKESDWKYLPLIKSLTALSALLHDWGKSTALFQEKLKPNSKIKGDPIRHEWVSCLLLHAFISQNSEDWLYRLAEGKIDERILKETIIKDDKYKVLKDLPNSAKLLMWLIVSHHRLPLDMQNINHWQGEEAFSIEATFKNIQQSWGYENRRDEEEYKGLIDKCFEFKHGLLSNSPKWMKNIKKWSHRMIGTLDLLEESIKEGSYRVVLHHARLALMLGDHNYSSQNSDSRWSDTTGLFANTDSKSKELKQKLDEHLCGVMASALKTIHLLPAFEKELPMARENRHIKRASPKAYAWQDKAVKKIEEIMDSPNKKGFFAVNMASTGCGKTFANAKVMRAVSEDKRDFRYILALGLRTLTLQTGDEYREKIGLEDDELAVLIGSKAVLELHDKTKSEADKKEEYDSGSESIETLLDEEVVFDCDIPEEGLTTILKKYKDKQFLYAPILVCTIDHLMGAVTTKRGGKYILPSLRLMSSDLVIDEIDDFSGSDLIAIGRLVHLAGVLGRKVMISSATIPPDLAEGYFNAYKKGWQLFTKMREAKNEIVCAWIDEFRTEVESVNTFESGSAIKQYNKSHTHFINKRVESLAKQSVKRKVDIIACPEVLESNEESHSEEHYFMKIKEALIEKHHNHHTIDKQTDKSVSFGVVRMANIRPCVALAKYLMSEEYPIDIEVKVMAYHSNQVLLLRHEQEKHLDAVLKRKEKEGEEPKAFTNPIIRSHLDSSHRKNIIFIVVATPVEEVGRDHDFDWAVIEPSSYRSIIQLAGRVHRHRKGTIDKANIALMEYNYKAFTEGDKEKKYFNKPGYEEGHIRLKTHNISKLVDTKFLAQRLDATMRIQRPKKLKPKESLSDLEHYMTEYDLSSYEEVGADTLQGYLDESCFLTAHPQYFHPFRQSSPTISVFLTYDAKSEGYFFAQYDKYHKLIVDISYNPVNREFGLNIKHSETDEALEANTWLKRDYSKLIELYSESEDKSKQRTSLRFGELNFAWVEGEEYEYSDQFGLVRV